VHSRPEKWRRARSVRAFCARGRAHSAVHYPTVLAIIAGGSLRGLIPFFAVYLACSAMGADSAQGFPKLGEWPCFRRDKSLDARSPAQGDITQPRIAWRQFLGTLETKVVIEPNPTDREVTFTGIERPTVLNPPLLSGFFPSETGEEGDNGSPNVVYADVLPDDPGKEKIEFESGFAKPTINGQWQDCVGHCYAKRNGQWVQRWETAKIPYLFQALPLAGDFDHDGQPEIAILPFYELLLLDARTGRLKDRCRFTDTRSYGFFGVYDFEGDGRSEFLIEADFSKHVDVLGFRNGKLAILWQKLIETDISNPQKILRVGPNQVADVDGDGRLEVLINTFNDSGDHRWHLCVHDAMTGRVKADLPDECLAAPLDVDGDGVSELLTYRTVGAGVPDFSTISVRALRGDKLVALWEQANSSWATWEPPLSANVKSTATFGRRTVICQKQGKTAKVVIQRKLGAESKQIATSVDHWEQGSFQPDLSVTGEGVEALGLDNGERLLVRLRQEVGQSATFSIKKGEARLHSTIALGVSPGTVAVAWPDQAAEPIIVAQGSGEELVTLSPPRNTRPIESLRRISGRGQSTSWPEARGPVVADLRGDGHRQVLLATAAPSGCARMVARDLIGGELWHHDFPQIPGTAPVWNTGGLILWQVGNFTDAGRQDVLVTVRRSMMHSEETGVLSALDGHELWHRTRQISQRGVGGTPFAIADYDHDGLDDAASLHPSILYLLQGATGRDILAQDASWPDVPAKPVYWGQPIAGDFLNNGQTTIFFAGRSMTGLVRTDGSLAWWDSLDKGAQDWPAFGNFSGMGRREMLGWGYEDGLRCYDTATGKIRWRMALPVAGIPSGCATADLDHDGRDEAVFVIDKTLACIGATRDGAAGELRWKLDLPAAGGPPSLASLDQGGRLSILVMGADGWLYCVR
jgi:hypothetical protein